MNKKGFTLIELLVVVAIIGVLASIILTSLRDARESARDSRRIAEINQMKNALELYYQDNNEYPNPELSPGDGSTFTSNCLYTDGNTRVEDQRWALLMEELEPYLSSGIEIETSEDWPVCTYYMVHAYSPCGFTSGNQSYGFLTGTYRNTYNYPILNEYSSGSRARYCIKGI